jgi:hypothetical protein
VVCGHYAAKNVLVQVLYIQAQTAPKMSNIVEDNSQDQFANGQRCRDLRVSSDGQELETQVRPMWVDSCGKEGSVTPRTYRQQIGNDRIPSRMRKKEVSHFEYRVE